MNLIIDVGNTRAKICVFDGNDMIHCQIAPSVEDGVMAVIRELMGRCVIDAAIMCSVQRPMPLLLGFLEKQPFFFLNMAPGVPMPICNGYSTPNTLGMDRLAAAVGAQCFFPGSDVLVIDAGTAITFDFLKGGREFAGGNIAPGIRLRFKALNDYTSRLPLVEAQDICRDFGLSTPEAINNGVVLGVAREIEGYVSDFKKKNVKAEIILTGGDSIFLSKWIKIAIFAEPNLVNIGLNRILNYNVLKEN